MKSFIKTCLLVGALIICGCSGKSGNGTDASFAGTFSTDYGITFTLNEDSTTFIDFGDDITYKGRWQTVEEGDERWANIEFNGNKQYYYLKGGKIYRSRINMVYDKFGVKVRYN